MKWNKTKQEYPRDKCVHELFETQVERTPDATAVVFGAEQFSYGALNRRANQLAHYLVGLNVGPEDVVALAVPRSIEMVVALLGVLKAGAAYLPIDPDYPAERLTFMLKDAGTACVLKTSEVLLTLPRSLACIELDAPEVNEVLAQTPASNPGDKERKHPVISQNAALIIYTSGSTGWPKGVVVLHSGGVNRLCWFAKVYPFRQEEPVLAKTSLSFIDGFTELLGPLLHGGSVVLCDSLSAKSPTAMAKLAGQHAIGRITVVPSLLTLLLDERNALQMASCRLWITSGERLTHSCAASFEKAFPKALLLNLYGASECTGDSLFSECNPSNVSIGRPISNTEIYILDDEMGAVPVGTKGELYIGGAGLARGYVNRPELTAERFVPNPFGKSGSRLYRTGDLARHREDGNIEYLGRMDHQVKIRGHRVELREIEAALERHADVEQAVVIVQEDAPGEKTLVAYVTSRREPRPVAGQLREYLREKLPEYMVPSFFVLLEKLPLTPSGKVDRKALPASDISSDRREKYVAPRTPVEELLCGIWAEVLRVPRVGIHDNFFDLGGHSLLAMQLLLRISAVLQKEVSLSLLFRGKGKVTVEGLAEQIYSSRGHDRPFLPSGEPNSQRRAPMLSFLQDGWLVWEYFAQLRNATLEPFHVSFGLHLTGALDVEALERALNDVVERHDVLRTAFPNVSSLQKSEKAAVISSLASPESCLRKGCFVPNTHAKCELKLARKDLSKTSGDSPHETWRIMSEEIIRTFEYDQPPLMRAVLVRIADTEYQLIVVLHHLISDGWSMGVLWNELQQAYRFQVRPTQATALPELSVQYFNYVAWERSCAEDQTLIDTISYWRDRWGEFGTEVRRALPVAISRIVPFNKLASASTTELPVAASQGLRLFAAERGITLYSLFLAGVFACLYSYTGNSRLAVWGLFGNRRRREVEGLIGWFATRQLLGIKMDFTLTAGQFVESVQEVVVGAIAHQHLPVEFLKPLYFPGEVNPVGGDQGIEITTEYIPVVEAYASLEGLNVRPAALPLVTNSSNIKLGLADRGVALDLVATCSKELYGAFVRRLLRYLDRAISQIVANSEMKIGSLIRPF